MSTALTPYRPAALPADLAATETQRAFVAQLDPHLAQMAALLPKSFTPDRLVTAALIAATKTPQLLEASPESVALSILKVAQWGLEIGTTAYLLPFRVQGKMTCEAIPSWTGLVEMMIRSGHVRDVRARVVYEKDVFRVRFGVEETLEHEPFYGGDPGKITHVYAVAILRHGRSTFEVMTVEEVERIRATSKQKDGATWRLHWEEMGKKTLIRRIAKRLPQNANMNPLLEADDRVAAAETVPIQTLGEDPYTSFEVVDGERAPVTRNLPTADRQLPAPARAEMTIEQAARLALMGSTRHFAGNGGKPIGSVDVEALITARDFFEQKVAQGPGEGEAVDPRYAEQLEAILLVLDAREQKQSEAAADALSTPVPGAGETLVGGKLSDALPVNAAPVTTAAADPGLPF